MSIDSLHYVPVLKVKRGEKKALQSIAPAIQRRVTPLLEIVERKAEKAATLEGHLDTAFKDLAKSVQPYSRCLMDAHEIASDGPVAAAAVFGRALAEGITFTPVTGVSRSADVAAALEHRVNGIAVRLTRDDFEKGGLATRLQGFMQRFGVTPEETDLIVDLGPLEDFVAAGVSALTVAFLVEVPDHTSWRTLTLSACAFPWSLGKVERRSHAYFGRLEWATWRDGLYAGRHTRKRLPTFGDCAIQHPSGVEGFDPRIMPVSAAIRYALPDSWLLIKGESTRLTPPSVQFPRLAIQLVYGHLRSNFAGADHCQGCAGIKAAADGASGFGSPEIWRKLGTIHHITRVVQDLTALPWP